MARQKSCILEENMRTQLVVLPILFVAVFSAHIQPNDTHALPTDSPKCSTDASKSYIDIILVIDTSASMGTSNLKKISTTMSLIVPKFPIGNNADLTQGVRNTRIAVVAYDTVGRIAANFTDINSANDLSKVLNGLTASTNQEANLYDGMLKAFYVKTNCSDPSKCKFNFNYIRPTAMILFAATSNGPNFDLIPDIVWNTDYFDDATLITVNFNSADKVLDNLLKQISLNKDINAPMYNLLSTSNLLTRDLEWAILQANCYCMGNGEIVIHYDQTNQRYEKYALCMIGINWLGDIPSNTLDMCMYDKSMKVIPAYVLSSEKMNFIADISGNSGYPFYMGMHKNKNSQWVWYDYDLTEFPLSGYSAWAPGYPDSNPSDGCTIIDSNDGINLYWKTQRCNSGLNNIMCQGRACDAANLYCCQYCNQVMEGGLVTESFHQRRQALQVKNSTN